MKRAVAISLGILCVAALCAGALAAAEKATIWPAGDIKWTDNPAMKGAKVAVLWGDPAKSAYGVFRKVPAGAKLGLHTHTQDQKVVMIAGAIEFNMEGGARTEMGPGSYAFIPGGAAHDATCKAGADCVYFEEAAGAADFKPVAKK
jgi:quercetin dioxygenase-like cupin family protein